MEQWVMQLLRQGHLSLPTMFMRYYKGIGLTDQEMMLIIQILTFKQEGKDFPTISEIQDRMSADERDVIVMLQKLVQKGYLAIEDRIEADTGMRAESYQLDPLYEKIAEQIAVEHAARSAQQAKDQTEQAEPDATNLFTIFEQEFGRPLSPIECETIAMWQDQDQHKDELIVAALREAVVSNKLFIRYIDRILYEWQRNRISTAAQAREFSLKFRRRQHGNIMPNPNQQTASPQEDQAKATEPFPFYNWLEN
ncbi:hypothetical protein BEP19_02145 [Ammoniphilus oxalaticus]|uniref:Uncharacterized protein n=1 Tax=Ammoniphilus oxalaticus TaxID=66863 RepID=A0A419SN92_9BACL|nr:DnaD domain-containing protein [Ammoniphilus oxalaticus]RKD25764.1 hypothetical protein BEP19_02145 [Ammoniphilus oxalaticus]